MSNGHTPEKGQDGLSYDFAKPSPSYQHLNPDEYHPEDLNSAAFADATSSAPRQLGAEALQGAHQTAPNTPGTPDQFYPQSADGMPLPMQYDSSIVNLPPPGVIPDPSEVAPRTPDRLTNASDTLDRLSDTPSQPSSTPETLSSRPQSPSRQQTPTTRFFRRLNPLAPSAADENRFQGQKGRLGGRARKELTEADHALNKGDTEKAYRSFRNAMAGFVGEYANRSAQDFQKRMWKDHPHAQ